jgi:hypothetical protein
MKRIIKAWIEDDDHDEYLKKLCIRLDDQDLYTLGAFDINRHEVKSNEFIGLTEKEACDKFTGLVYKRS